MSTKASLAEGVTIYPLGDEAVLFVGRTRALVRLSPSAAVICRGLQAELPLGEIARRLSKVSLATPGDVRRDLDALIEELRAVGALAGSPAVAAADGAGTPARRSAAKRRLVFSPGPARSGTSRDTGRYRLVDYGFSLRAGEDAVPLARRMFGHLAERSAGKAGASPESLELVEEDGWWRLGRDGVVVDECGGLDEIAPMLHAHVLMAAYRSSNCIAAVHAAAVTRGGDCILMPGASGSGKTTLTAALLAAGFGYATDDMALLEGRTAHVRAAPVCLGVKRGSWPLLAGRFPEIDRLPVHTRADGKRIRYLPPPSMPDGPAGPARYRVRSIVFPTCKPGSRAELKPLSAAEGLVRLTSAGYDLPRPMTSEPVEFMLGWLSVLRCFDLSFGDLDDAVAAVSELWS